jgi:nucleotide-binding universal stress UspA family protein
MAATPIGIDHGRRPTEEESMQEPSPAWYRRADDERLAGRNRLTRPSWSSPRPALEASLRQQRPVICAVDNDDLAAGALATAAVLAAELAVPLTVIHSPAPDMFLVGEPRRAALERGNAFVDELAEGYTVDERIVELNDPAQLVIDVATEGATMIVIGTRRRTGFRAALLGSVSHSVIGSAICPVVAVPSAGASSMAPSAREVAAVTSYRSETA